MRMSTLKISTIQEDLTEQCSAILYSYRRNCASTTVHSQVRTDGSPAERKDVGITLLRS
jgi:hypothetical protein